MESYDPEKIVSIRGLLARKPKSIMRLLNIIKKKPLTEEAIDKLVAEGWKVVPTDDHSSFVNRRKKIIGLKTDFKELQRDVSFLHEVAHAFYGQALTHNHPLDPDTVETFWFTDWLAKQWRRNPELLRHAILKFGLEPRIYDHVTRKAFSEQRTPEQFVLPGMEPKSNGRRKTIRK
ncbi:hypothetical protein HY991_00815 [Candidatus Micrarchaeota archaeon]|nr:hypothetical protein [Candidatus Micrarchaeota archaeon]